MGTVVSRAANKCLEHQLTIPLFGGKSPVTMKQLGAGSAVLTLKYGRAGAETSSEGERIFCYCSPSGLAAWAGFFLNHICDLSCSCTSFYTPLTAFEW